MMAPRVTLRMKMAASLCALLALTATAWPPLAAAQQVPAEPVEERVVNLAAGRVIIAVVKDAILIATLENPIEPETRPPVPVPLGADRAGIVLGAVEWIAPESHRQIALLDRELPGLRSQLIAPAPHLQPNAGQEATDVEAVGQAFLERLDTLAQGLHAKVDLPAGAPIAELILADFASNYGPEVWQLSYGIKQTEQESGYWTTRARRPTYLQFWPPEKGQPRTLIELAYPEESAPTPLLALLRQKDSRLQKLLASDAQMAQVAAQLLQGDTTKMSVADATQFLRAALDALSPHGARQTLAIIRREAGFDWILPPPPEPVRPELQPDRPPGAPTLRKPNP